MDKISDSSFRIYPIKGSISKRIHISERIFSVRIFYEESFTDLSELPELLKNFQG